MTVQELITICKQQVEENYPDTRWVEYFNLALDDLTPVSFLKDKKEDIAVTLSNGNGTINLATAGITNIFEVISVSYGYGASLSFDTRKKILRQLETNDTVSEGWKYKDGVISLQNIEAFATSINVDIEYYKKLEHISYYGDLSTVIPPIPSEYHELLILFACAKSQQKEEEINDKNDFYAEYLIKKNNYALNRMWQIEPQSRRFLRQARLIGILGGTAQGGQS